MHPDFPAPFFETVPSTEDSTEKNEEDVEEDWLETMMNEMEGLETLGKKGREGFTPKPKKKKTNPLVQLQSFFQKSAKLMHTINSNLLSILIIFPSWYDQTMLFFADLLFSAGSSSRDEKYREHDADVLRYLLGLVVSVILTLCLFGKNLFIYLMSLDEEGGGFFQGVEKWNPLARLSFGATLIMSQQMEYGWKWLGMAMKAALPLKNLVLLACLAIAYTLTSNIDLTEELKGLMTGHHTTFQTILFGWTMTLALAAYIIDMISTVGSTGPSIQLQLVSVVLISIMAALYMFVLSNVSVIIGGMVFIAIFTASSFLWNIDAGVMHDFMKTDTETMEQFPDWVQSILKTVAHPWFAYVSFILVCVLQQVILAYTALQSKSLRFTCISVSLLIPFILAGAGLVYEAHVNPIVKLFFQNMWTLFHKPFMHHIPVPSSASSSATPTTMTLIFQYLWTIFFSSSSSSAAE
jgi:hypothetical protein